MPAPIQPAVPDTHALEIIGTLPTGPFASETHNAGDPEVGGPAQDGSIYFDDGQGLAQRHRPRLHRPAADPRHHSGNRLHIERRRLSRPVVQCHHGATWVRTIEFASTPTVPTPTNFETTAIANKSFVNFNTPPEFPGIAGPGLIGTVNIPTASTGLLSLTFDTPTAGDNNVAFVNTPAGVVTTLYGGIR